MEEPRAARRSGQLGDVFIIVTSRKVAASKGTTKERKVERKGGIRRKLYLGTTGTPK
jgi:hypothetical protein